jgi:hypothetical protein
MTSAGSDSIEGEIAELMLAFLVDPLQYSLLSELLLSFFLPEPFLGNEIFSCIIAHSPDARTS